MPCTGAFLYLRRSIIWDELAERHFAYWTPENIQGFWAGTSFHEPGEANELSYSLAEVLLKLLAERGSVLAFQEFLKAADPRDAGQHAAVECMNSDLGQIAGTFLGEGNWRPDRRVIARNWDRAGWTTQATGAETGS